MRKIRIFVLMLAVMLTAVAQASDFLVLQRRADDGDKEAMYHLGNCYYNGDRDVERNMQKAFIWYKKAADKGYVPALRELGLCYLYGEGVKASSKNAWKCLEKAAKKGDANSAYYMAQMYKEGLHGKKEYADKEYLRQLVKAAEMGSEDALYEWGMMHYEGSPHFGISPDRRGGMALILDAAEKGSADALYFAGLCYLNGTDGVRMDQQKAFSCFSKAVESGNALALCDLAECYIKGYGTKQNLGEAYRCLDKAERAGVTGASRMLGDMYANGIDVKYNPAKATQYYRKAEAAGDKEAPISEAMMVAHGKNREAEAHNVFHTFSDASAKGSRMGFEGLGDCYLEGISVMKSPAKALECYRKALEMGSVHAAAQIGNMYYTGTEATPRDYDKAVKYFRVFLSDPMSVPRAVRASTYRRIAECYRFGRGMEQDNQAASEYTRKAYEDGEEELKILLDN